VRIIIFPFGRPRHGVRAAGRMPTAVSFWAGHRRRPPVCVRACVARRRKIRFRCAGEGSHPQ
jgi:hypothetical protein